jgi:hypothetical protein
MTSAMKRQDYPLHQTDQAASARSDLDTLASIGLSLFYAICSMATCDFISTLINRNQSRPCVIVVQISYHIEAYFAIVELCLFHCSSCFKGKKKFGEDPDELLMSASALDDFLRSGARLPKRHRHAFTGAPWMPVLSFRGFASLPSHVIEACTDGRCGSSDRAKLA